MDDIVRTVKFELTRDLFDASSLHPNLQLTQKEADTKKNLPFLDLNTNRSQEKGVTYNWYKKKQQMLGVI